MAPLRHRAALQRYVRSWSTGAEIVSVPPQTSLRTAVNREQLRQLGDVGGDAPRLVAGEELGRCTPTGVILEID
jgi:hypothetical protein